MIISKYATHVTKTSIDCILLALIGLTNSCMLASKKEIQLQYIGIDTMFPLNHDPGMISGIVSEEIHTPLTGEATRALYFVSK